MKLLLFNLFSLVLFSCLLQEEDLLRNKRSVEFTDELDMDEYHSFKGANVRMARSVAFTS
jgi:hypothetical protein